MTQAPEVTPIRPASTPPGRPTGIPTGRAGSTGPAPASPPPPTLTGRLNRAAEQTRRGLAGTPGRLRILALVAVVAAIGFALSAGQAFRAADGAIARAEANTDQLIRIQAINTALMRADAGATNAFLVGGLEPADRRADYTSSVASATRLIADAARAQPADGAALAALNQTLVDYTGLIETARANNRQGLPIGAQYLRGASSSLRGDALPLLTALVSANEERARDEFDGALMQRIWLAVTGGLAVLVLVLGMLWLARRTHRFVNVPLAAGTLAVLIMTVGGFAALSAVSSTVASTRDGPFTATLATAQARIAAFDAKSNESLTLIARGSGGAYEAAWKKSSTAVQSQSTGAGKADSRAGTLAAAWQPYVTVHTAVRAADDGGDWEGAVRKATGTATGTSNAAFDAFDATSGKALTTVSTDVTGTLASSRGWLPYAGLLALLVGLLAAVGAWWGVSLRLEEYR